MKKILSLALALLLVLSTALLFTGCKTEKTPVEMFKLGSEKLLGVLEGDVLPGFANADDFNKMTMSVGGIDIAGMLGLEESLEASVELGAAFLEGGNLFADLTLGLGDDKISAKSEFKDGDFYFSVPDASEYFLYAPNSEFAVTESTDTTKYLEDFAKALEEFGAKYVTAENVTSETVDVTVFGKEIKGANKVTLNLDEEALEELALNFADIMVMLFEEMPEPEEDTKLSASFSYIFDGEVLKQIIIEAKNSESEYAKTTLDVAIGDTSYEFNGTVTLVYDDVTEEYPVAFKHSVANGEINGSFSFEFAGDSEDPDAESLAASVTYTGTYTDTTIEADYNVSVKMAGVSVELPFKMTATAADNKFTYVIDIDTKIMDYDIDTTLTIVTEKVEDLKSGEYDMSMAADADDEESEAATIFLADLLTYLSEFENLEPIIGMLMMGGEDFGGDFGGDMDFASPLFEISSGDSEYIVFNDDGTATYYVSYDLDADKDAGVFTILTGGDDIVITLNDDGTADINGLTYDCEVTEFEGMAWYEFLSDEYSTEFGVYFSDDADPIGEIYQHMAYEMDDTTLTLDYLNGSGPFVLQYTLDEDEGTMTLGNVVYDYYTYDYEY